VTARPANRLTQPGYRARFLIRLFLVSAAGAAVLFGVLRFALSQRLPDDYSGIFHILRAMPMYVRGILVTSVLAYVLLVFGSLGALCVYWLHKVAGPLYRMERVMEAYRSGLPTRTVSFRHGDQIEPLATAFNDWIGALRKDRQRWLAAMEEAERLCLQEDAICKAHMKAALRKVEADLFRYR
jgi:hypothetical protein